MSDDGPKKDPRKPDAWMISFGDLVSLMLVFFVMLFAMSELKVDEWSEVVEHVSRTFVPTEQSQTKPSAQRNIGTTFTQPAESLEYLSGVLSDKLGQHEVLQRSFLHRLDDRLVLSLPSDLLFDTGTAQLTPRAREAIYILAGFLRNFSNQIAIYGHTDPRPITGGPFESNWELSLVRATTVVNQLRSYGYTQQLQAFAVAESRYDHLSSALTTAQRLEVARRVDIVILHVAGKGP
ncbi:MAG: flagellar motor protein MotB [Acetobacterales bacterium]